MKTNRFQTQRLSWALLGVALALLLIVGLSLLLVRFPVLAQGTGGPDAADLRVNKEVSKDRASPGDTLVYTITVSNNLAEPVEAWMTDTLPAELTLVSGPETILGDVRFEDGVITWSYTLLALQSNWITWSTQVSPEMTSGEIVNTAQVTGTGKLHEDSATTMIGSKDRYFPFIARRWPPIPYPPTLNDIENPDSDPDYTVTWSYPYSNPPVTSFTLQEDTDADFGDPTEYQLGSSTTSKSFTDKAGGTYYYRVHGNNTWGQGEWSDVKTVSVFSYFDNFSNYRSGWPREWEKTRGALYQVRPYEHPKCPGADCEYDEGDGYIIARRSDSNPRAQFGPDVKVPSENYEIEVQARWWDAAYFATYQIFFGSDDDFENYYALEVRINIAGGDSGDCEYRLIRQSQSVIGYGGIAGIESARTLQDWTSAENIHCGLRSRKNTPWNDWKIRREGDEIKLWVNGDKLGTWTDSKYGANRYFGVGCTLYEGFTPSIAQVDNFSVRTISPD